MTTIVQRRWSGLVASKITGSNWDKLECSLSSPSNALLQIVDHSDFRAALSWSNPDLFQKLERREVTVESSLSLRRYALRFVFRATPSGLFGWTDHLGDADSKGIVDISQSSLLGMLCQADFSRADRLIQINPTLYRVGSEYRVYHRRTTAPFLEELSVVEWTHFIEEIVYHLSDTRELTEAALVEFVRKQAECDLDQATEFVQGLCLSGLLLRKCASNLVIPPIVQEGAGRRWSSVREAPSGSQGWPRVCNHAGSPTEVTSVEPNRDHWYVNAKIAQAPSSISKRVITAIGKFLGAVGTSGDMLAEFKRAFDRRYGGSWVPLMIALDPEVGIEFKALSDKAQKFVTGLSSHGAKAVSRVVERVSRNATAARIDIDDVIHDLAPAGVDGFIALVERSDVVNPSYSLKKAASRGLLRPLMRNMAHGDARLTSIREHLDVAAGLDATAADVLADFPPSLRDLARHPPFTTSVIVTNYQEQIEGVKVILANDLEVSVLRGSVVLRNAETHEAIAPVTSTAISPQVADNVIFTFLSFVESQHALTVSDDWLRLAVDGTYLPSLVYAGIEVSPRQWLIRNSDFDEMSPTELIVTIRKLPHFPRFVQFGRGDKKISFDMECGLSFEIFLKELAKRGELWLTRCAHQAPFAAGPEAGEYAVCQLGDLLTSPSESRRGLGTENGFGWLYFKLFSSEQALSGLLPSIAQNLVALAQKSVPGQLQWHYLFFPHEGNHMRIRLCIPIVHREKLRESLRQFAVSASGIPFATIEECHYRPEHTRYGRHLGLIHEFWTMDSTRCLELLGRQVSLDQHLLRIALAVSDIAEDVGMNFAAFNDAIADGCRTYRREFTQAADRVFLRTKMDSLKRTPSIRESLIFRARELNTTQVPKFPDLVGFFHDLTHLSIARIHPVDFRRMEWTAYELWMKVLRRNCI